MTNTSGIAEPTTERGRIRSDPGRSDPNRSDPSRPDPNRSRAQGDCATDGPGSASPAFEPLIERRPPGLIRRFLTTQRHVLGLLGGGLVAWIRDAPKRRRRGSSFFVLRLLSCFVRPFVKRSLRRQSFPVQLRRRLEILGPTYIKLGQILSLRQDILPKSVTEELENLLDHLPVVSIDRFLEIVSEALGRPAKEMFASVVATPLGSASIAQTHRARTREGDEVVLKVVKPGIRVTLRRDAVLLKLLGRFLQILFPRYKPRRVLQEFVDYTLREVDLRLEADNAETFRANFADLDGVVFPKIYRRYSSETVLCMEYIRGRKPSDPQLRTTLPESDRDRLIDLGAAAIIRMLYGDGFFHADLHPGNLLVLPGGRMAFIDLGMVGRFSDELRRTLLYYYYCLVTGDAGGAARYLSMVAEPDSDADLPGFRRAVEEVSRRWHRSANFDQFSLAQLMLESVQQGAEFRMYFPVELVLMVKAIVTFEGVGQHLKPGFDVASVSKRHVDRIFLQQFSPLRLAREALHGAPEMVDALIKAPMLITEGLRLVERQAHQPGPNPFSGIRATVFGGFCLLAGTLLLTSGTTPWYWVAGLLALGVLLALKPGR